MSKRDSMATIIAKVLLVKCMNIQSITAPEFMVKDDQICYCVRYVNGSGKKSFVILRGPDLELIYKVPVEHLGKMHHDLAVWFRDVCGKHLSQSKAAQILGYSQAYICMKHKEFCNILTENRFVNADELVEGTRYDIYDSNFEPKMTCTFVGRNENGELRFLRELYDNINMAWAATGELVRGEKSAARLYFKEV